MVYAIRTSSLESVLQEDTSTPRNIFIQIAFYPAKPVRLRRKTTIRTDVSKMSDTTTSPNAMEYSHYPKSHYFHTANMC